MKYSILYLLYYAKLLQQYTLLPTVQCNSQYYKCITTYKITLNKEAENSLGYLFCRLSLYSLYSSFKLSEILETRLCNSLAFGLSTLRFNKEAPIRVKCEQNTSTSLSLLRHNIIPKTSLSRLKIQNELPASICRSELIDIIPISSRISRVRPKLSLKARRDFPILTTDI